MEKSRTAIKCEIWAQIMRVNSVELNERRKLHVVFPLSSLCDVHGRLKGVRSCYSRASSHRVTCSICSFQLRWHRVSGRWKGNLRKPGNKTPAIILVSFFIWGYLISFRTCLITHRYDLTYIGELNNLIECGNLYHVWLCCSSNNLRQTLTCTIKSWWQIIYDSLWMCDRSC